MVNIVVGVSKFQISDFRFQISDFKFEIQKR